MRGLDNRAYYRLDDNGRDVDVTGCGNTLDFRHPRVVQLTLDSLRYWVQHCHVDGFRFDLATALARGRDDGYDPDHPFLVAMRSRSRSLPGEADRRAVGRRPARLAHRASSRRRWPSGTTGTATPCARFWLTDAARAVRGEPGHGVRELATRLSGSQDLFGVGDRGPLASVNYVAAHDGFTLADTTAYEHKHNQDNGEGNRDGHDDNRSWNHGVGGHDERRRRAGRGAGARCATCSARCCCPPACRCWPPATSSGAASAATTTPTAGTTSCRGSTGTWPTGSRTCWRPPPTCCGFGASTRRCASGSSSAGGRRTRTARRDLGWFAADGSVMDEHRWHDPGTRVLQAFLHGDASGGRSLLLVLCGAADDVEVTLPGDPWATTYDLLWDSSCERPGDPRSRPQRRP